MIGVEGLGIGETVEKGETSEAQVKHFAEGKCNDGKQNVVDGEIESTYNNNFMDLSSSYNYLAEYASSSQQC